LPFQNHERFGGWIRRWRCAGRGHRLRLRVQSPALVPRCHVKDHNARTGAARLPAPKSFRRHLHTESAAAPVQRRDARVHLDRSLPARSQAARIGTATADHGTLHGVGWATSAATSTRAGIRLGPQAPQHDVSAMRGGQPAGGRRR